MSNKKKILFTLIFSLLVFVVSFFTKKDAAGTYLSLGDAFILLSACFLPTGWAMLVALLGNGIFFFVTCGWEALLAITACRVLSACWFMDDDKKLFTSRLTIGAVMSFVLLSVGPFIFNLLKTQNMSASLPVLGAAALGAAANIILLFGLAFIVDKFKIKEKIQ